MSVASPRLSNFSGTKQIHGLDILNDRTQERLILRLYMGNSLRLDCEALPDTLFPCQSVEAPAQLAMYSYKTTKVPSIPMYHFAWLKSLEDKRMQRSQLMRSL